MKTPTVLKTGIPSLVLAGISLTCALRVLSAPQVANFSDDAKDRHVGRILLPASPSKPIQPAAGGVIKTSSTQSKAQLLLDSLKGSGAQNKAPVTPAPPMAGKEVKSNDHQSEVKGSKSTEASVVKGKSEEISKASAPNSSDKKANPALKGGSPSSSHLKTRTFRNDGFIPPPPPVQPSILMNGAMGESGIMPFTVEYMNKDELLQKQKDLELQLSDAKTQLKDTEEAGAEKKTRAERFDPLYKEGVVSRHELEAAQKEALEVDKEVERAKNRVTDLQNQSASVERKLKEIAKRTLPVSAPSRKKTRK